VPRALLSHVSCEWHQNQAFVRSLAHVVTGTRDKDKRASAGAHRKALGEAWRRLRDACTGVAMLAAFHVRSRHMTPAACSG
jgi:hypothetical protein